MKPRSKALLLVLATLLSGCGGGGGANGGAAAASVAPVTTATLNVNNAIPSANAGPDQSVIVGATVTVDGGASSDANGDPLGYRWTLISKPAGSSASILLATAKTPTFIADVVGSYVAALVVNDGRADSAADQVSISAAASPAVVPPVASAGANQSVLVGAAVAVDASASKSASGKSLTYRWAFTSRPAGSTALLSVTSSKATFIADMAGIYAATVIVNDGTLDSGAATTFITATAPPTQLNTLPVANAGVDQSGYPGALITLDGSLSKDANGDMLSYAWSVVSRPATSTAPLSMATTVKATFVPDVAGVYDVKLSVNDGKSTTAVSDSVSIVIFSPSITVVADTGIYRCSTISKTLALQLYAQGHTYLDRDHDGKPCEANDIVNELVGTTTTTTTSSGGQCYVNGYYRSNGTYVHGYYRSCPR
ncbi:MAG: hypothetical protein JWP59_596 [Massilia sp.]|jgi:hypothetical protein|nr:hypothetical protein [Massilia sp.]